MRALLANGPDELDMGPRQAVQIWQPDDRLNQGPPLSTPSGPGELAAHYDLTISQPSPDQPQMASFDRWLARAAARHGLSCALIHDGIVHEAIDRLQQGRLTIGYHLDYFALWQVADDPYARLACAVQDAGGRSVNLPARSRAFTDKAAAHAELMRRGLGVPETVMFRPWTPARALTDAERRRLCLDQPGARVYIKAANGFASRGLVCTERTDAESLQAALASIRNYDWQDTFLLQREVRCPLLAGDDGAQRSAYWRVLWCLGELIPFWWRKGEADQGRPNYQRLTLQECGRHGLWPVLDFVQEIAELTGLEWFSTELCLSEGPESSRYTVQRHGGNGGRHQGGERWPVVAIDYVNDQCDVDVQSRWLGAPPDGVVYYLAEQFAAAALKQREATAAPDTAARLRLAA